MASHSKDDGKAEWTEAEIVDLKTFGSVKVLRLKVADKTLIFKPGQWVDFNIPGVSPFTGYSMMSPPSLLASSGVLELAIKYTDYPPTLWVHEKCIVGDRVLIRVGGDFYYSPPEPYPTGDLVPEDVLLLAAGIGINPLYSILQHLLEEDKRHVGRVALLYGCRTPADILFKDEILDFARQNSFFFPKLFSSKGPIAPEEEKHIKGGRISEMDITEALSSLNKSSVQVFICGPPEFLDHMEMYCLSSGLCKNQIHYEKWW